ncbi:UTRA domain-containing protein [Streptomyces sp. NPDC017941]|uniref:UTRA domain-containing protein n=1 Tax=unclassified Streptomyces TaxID=2593676 RepID=UPI0037ACD0FF
MTEAYERTADQAGNRTRAVRSNLRHQWEKDRARASREERADTGATEHDTGLETEDLVFHASYRETKADEDLAAAFGVDEGTALVERSYRTRYAAETTPLTLVTSYLVRDVVAANPDLLDDANEPWPGGTQNQLHTLGIEVDRFEEHVTARPPTPAEASELGLPPGMPVLVLRKLAYDTADRVVELSDIKLPGDRMELVFTTRLDRW